MHALEERTDASVIFAPEIVRNWVALSERVVVIYREETHKRGKQLAPTEDQSWC